MTIPAGPRGGQPRPRRTVHNKATDKLYAIVFRQLQCHHCLLPVVPVRIYNRCCLKDHQSVWLHKMGHFIGRPPVDPEYVLCIS